MYKVKFHKIVEKFLEKKDKKFLFNFKSHIIKLCENPFNNNLDIKPFN